MDDEDQLADDEEQADGGDDTRPEAFAGDDRPPSNRGEQRLHASDAHACIPLPLPHCMAIKASVSWQFK